MSGRGVAGSLGQGQAEARGLATDRGGPTSIHGYSSEYPNFLVKCLYLNILYSAYNKTEFSYMR
jgi:hypothetical protein